MMKEIIKIRRLIQLNKMRARAKADGDFNTYRDATLKLHKLEVKDKVNIGTYIISFDIMAQ